MCTEKVVMPFFSSSVSHYSPTAIKCEQSKCQHHHLHTQSEFVHRRLLVHTSHQSSCRVFLICVQMSPECALSYSEMRRECISLMPNSLIDQHLFSPSLIYLLFSFFFSPFPFPSPSGTMITSLDGYGATRQNGGLVNSFTHTTLPNNHLAGANFATLPHLHNHNHIASSQQQQQMHQSAAVSVATSGAGGGGGGGQAHVRFGTLPVRGAAGGNNSEKPQPPPAYPGNYFNGGGGGGGAAVGGGIPMMPVNGGPAMAAMHNGGNGILLNGGSGGSNGGIVNIHTPPHSVNSAANQVQTQVIYTAK